jgi:hypothetical protein
MLMPHRGKAATLRDRSSSTPVVENREAKSKFAQMSVMDILKWGLLYNRNVNKVDSYINTTCITFL